MSARNGQLRPIRLAKIGAYDAPAARAAPPSRADPRPRAGHRPGSHRGADLGERVGARVVRGWGIFDGPSDQASITAMKSFGVNAVRIPLNEACWNGESYVSSAQRGARHRGEQRAHAR